MKRFTAFLLAVLMTVCLGAYAGAQEQQTPDDVTVLAIGDTAETDLARFTLNEVCFTDLVGLDRDNWLKPVDGSGGLGPGSGKVFVWYSFSVKNLAKQSVGGEELCQVYVDYNDGYIYDQSTYTNGMYDWSTAQGISGVVGMPVLEPLEEADYYGYTACVQDVRTDRENPLLLVVTLPGSEGDVQFAYDYAAAEGADTSEQALAVAEALTTAVDELTFVQKYAGNTNGSGSRKFADSKIESIQNSLSGADMDYINANLPETAAVIGQVQANIDSICDMLVEMGNTNSDKDVPTMKSMAADTIAMIQPLLSGELGAFN